MKPSLPITQMIRDDHAAVTTQFHKITPDLAGDALAASAREICTALEIHAQLEEEIFYPALRAAGVQSPALDKSLPEHDTMRRLIEEVRGGPRAGGQSLHDALNALINSVLHHVADEETQLLPAAERFLGPQRLSELGAQMRQRRIELAPPATAGLFAGASSTAPAKAAVVTVAALLGSAMLLTRLRRRPAQL